MESCGKCFPCRLGMSHILEILERIADGRGRPGDMELMERVGVNMRGGSLCGHGQLGYNPVASAVRFFGGEFEAQFEDGAAPLGAFVGPKSTRRGAQMSGDTPTASVKPDFVMRIEPALPQPAGTAE